MTLIRSICIYLFILFTPFSLSAKDTVALKLKPSLHGTVGLTYEGYGLNISPAGSNIFNPRSPWNQARFNLNPVLQFGDVLSIPININIAATPTNFAGPWSGIGKGPNKQSFWQWITNPMNNVGINPKYKWAELLLGTQYIKFSDLSTGDVGAFGAGINLSPGIYRLKFFKGSSQRGINYLPPDVDGAYQRNHWMLQTGIEKEGNYRLLFNLVRGTDRISSVTMPSPFLTPQEGMNFSIIADKSFHNGFYWRSEYAKSFYTADMNQPNSFLLNFNPYLQAKTSSNSDEATQIAFGKRANGWDLGFGVKFVGAGFKTLSFPFMQPDYRDLTMNMSVNLFHQNTNINGRIGLRTNNLSDVTTESNQLIVNINTSNQVNDHLTVDVNYNNTGFQAGSSFTPYGIKNISNDLTISPSYIFTKKEVTHFMSMSYNFSTYKELLLVAPNTLTENYTHTISFTYIPTYTKRVIKPDFGLVYFNNNSSGLKNQLLTISSGLGMPVFNNKCQLKGQLQYTMGKLQSFSTNNNFLAAIQSSFSINKKMAWSLGLNTNFFKYGNELAPPNNLIGSNYVETNFRTGFQYRF